MRARVQGGPIIGQDSYNWRGRNVMEMVFASFGSGLVLCSLSDNFNCLHRAYLMAKLVGTVWGIQTFKVFRVVD